MSAWTALGTSLGATGRAVVVALGGAVIVGAGYLLSVDRPEPAVEQVASAPQPAAPEPVAPEPSAPEPAAAQPAAAPEVAAVPAPDSETPVADAAAPAPAAEPVAEVPAVAAAPEPPRFDNWRVDGVGEAVVAGMAAPGALVAVMVDGAEVAQATASATGEFAALFTLPANEKPSLMALEMRLADGSKIVSSQSVALAPIGGPVVAMAEPTVDAPAAETVEAVPATEAPAALLLTEEGAKVLQSGTVADPAITANVVLETIAYTAQGAVQLGGHGQPGLFIRIYLDNAEVMTAPVAPGGDWLLTLPDVAPDIYTLRVDQLDTDGKVSSRFETPFKRETREALAAAMGSGADPAPEQPAPEASVPEAGASEPVAPAASVEATAPATATAEPVATAEATGSAAPAEDVAPAGTTREPAATSDAATSDTATADTSTSDAQTAEAPAAPDVAAPVVAAPSEPAAPEALTQDTTTPPATDANVPPAVAVQPVGTDTETPAIAGSSPEAPVVAEVAAPDAVAAVVPAATPAPVTVTVQPGFTLWGIAEQRFGDGVLYVQVFEANKDKIRNPDLIYPGQVFTIPAAE